MVQYHYEWWTVDILTTAGKTTLEIKARNRENAVKQIEKEVETSNSEKNLNQKQWWKIKPPIKEVFWDTLVLDRIGYQRIG